MVTSITIGVGCLYIIAGIISSIIITTTTTATTITPMGV